MSCANETDGSGGASPPPPTAEAVRLGDFRFDPTSGELRRLDGSGVQRLAPQPARLLTLLVEKAGGVASHQEIRARLWPEVQVDFEQGLHFCVRQVRAALGDEANAPRYIATVPRRGYRLCQGVLAAPGESAAPSSAAAPRRWPGRVAGVSLVLLLIVGIAVMRRPPLPPTLAVMPFAAPATSAIDTRPIAERLLLRLGALGAERLGVVGPLTTGAWDSDLGSVRRMVEELELDLVINGRFIAGERLLVELIRGNDGVHLWVATYDDFGDLEAIAEQIGSAVIGELGLAPAGSEVHPP